MMVIVKTDDTLYKEKSLFTISKKTVDDACKYTLRVRRCFMINIKIVKHQCLL